MNPFIEMLGEIQSQRLIVALYPAPTPKHELHFVRVAISKNPVWYRNLCAAHASARTGYNGGKFKTKVKRAGIVRALELLADGKETGSDYADELRRIARNHGDAANFTKTAKSATLRLFG
jgi:hypothetical protein